MQRQRELPQPLTHCAPNPALFVGFRGPAQARELSTNQLGKPDIKSKAKRSVIKAAIVIAILGALGQALQGFDAGLNIAQKLVPFASDSFKFVEISIIKANRAEDSAQ